MSIHMQPKILQLSKRQGIKVILGQTNKMNSFRSFFRLMRRTPHECLILQPIKRSGMNICHLYDFTGVYSCFTGHIYVKWSYQISQSTSSLLLMLSLVWTRNYESSLHDLSLLKKKSLLITESTELAGWMRWNLISKPHVIDTWPTCPCEQMGVERLLQAYQCLYWHDCIHI